MVRRVTLTAVHAVAEGSLPATRAVELLLLPITTRPPCPLVVEIVAWDVLPTVTRTTRYHILAIILHGVRHDTEYSASVLTYDVYALLVTDFAIQDPVRGTHTIWSNNATRLH